jgi:hypothetical protein
MPAAIFEHSSPDEHVPVFVADGRRRHHAVRLAAATVGLLLAGWLAALAGGLIGFAPLPELALPGAGQREAAPAPPHQQSGGIDMKRKGPAEHASALATRGGSTGDQARATTRSASGTGAASEGTTAAAAGAASPTTGSGGGTGTTQPPPAGPGAGTPAQANAGHEPRWFTPPASGQESATPPRGKSAEAPGATISGDPSGEETRPQSG